jgi:UDP-N-acetylmuramyl pentapeptide phosphotransferase/UDP-N-acetylglucosamine-1-phosphate transferase
MHPLASVGLAFVLSGLVALAATPLVRAAARRLGFIDHPNPRSSHERPTPRGGGLAIAAGIAAVAAVYAPLWEGRPDALVFAGGAALVALSGLVDDRIRVPPLVRLAVHVVAAVAIVGAAGPLLRLPLPAPLDVALGRAGPALAVLWIVAAVDFYNFMDGIDGLASVQAAITGGVIAVASPDPLAAVLGAAVAGGSAGFLVFNWSPARIFLGDVGSGLLGYTLAAIPFLSPPETRDRVVLLVGTSLSLFLADATACVVRRVAQGRRFYEPHREHLYQRWANSGAGHERVTTFIAFGSLVTTLLAFLAWRESAAALAWAGLAAGIVLFVLEWRWVARLEGATGPRGGLDPR